MSGIPEQKEKAITSPTRAQRRANVAGMKKVLKKIRKGMSAEQISRKTGIPIESINYLENIVKAEEARIAEKRLLANMETETLIDGEEIR